MNAKGYLVTWTETVRKTATFYYSDDEPGPMEPGGSVNDTVVEALVCELEDPADTEELVDRKVESVEVLV